MTTAQPPKYGTNMTDYQAAVEQLAQTNSDFIFPNSSHDHAAIVFATMFKHSQKEVLIYDDCLDGKIADRHNFQLNTAIKHFLNQGKVLRIVIKDDSKFDSLIYNNLKNWKEKYPDTLDVRKSSDTFATKVRDLFSKDILFAVSDNKAIRVEKATGGTEREAFCSFNKPDYATSLTNVFASSFDTCEQISFQ